MTRVDRNAQTFRALLETKFHRTGEAAARPGAETILVLSEATGTPSLVPRALESRGRVVRSARTVDEAFHIMGQIVFDIVVVEDRTGSLSIPFAVGARARGQRIPMMLLSHKRSEDEWERYSGLFGRSNVFELPMTDHAIRNAVLDRIKTYRDLMAAAQRIGEEDHGPAAENPTRSSTPARGTRALGDTPPYARADSPSDEATGHGSGGATDRPDDATTLTIGDAFERY